MIDQDIIFLVLMSTLVVIVAIRSSLRKPREEAI